MHVSGPYVPISLYVLHLVLWPLPAMTKQCSKCFEVKPLDEFHLCCYGPNGACKACVKAKNKAYYEANKAKIAAKHSEQRAAGHVPDVGANARRQARPHAERLAERRQKVNDRKKERHATEPGFAETKAEERHYSRACSSRGHSWAQLVGCTSEMFELWLEFQFEPGMAHAGYPADWNIDHVRPRSSFDPLDPAQRAQCHHWANLAPIRSNENSRKHITFDAVRIHRQATRAYLFRTYFTSADVLRRNNA